jgi:hypothetical protein
MGKIASAIKDYGNALRFLKNNEQFDALVQRGLC